MIAGEGLSRVNCGGGGDSIEYIVMKNVLWFPPNVQNSHQYIQDSPQMYCG